VKPVSSYSAVEAVGLRRLELTQKTLPVPRPGKVRIHSDAGTVEGLFPNQWPRVPDHEVVGRIDERGSRVQGLALSRRVGVGSRLTSDGQRNDEGHYVPPKGADLDTTDDMVDFLSRRRRRASSSPPHCEKPRTASKDNIRVGSWVVAPTLNSISSGGRTVRIEPKVMAVLLCLAEHAGETVSKERLFATVWPNIYVTEDALKRCIVELRRAFDDNAREPSVIETISKRGYRLVAPIAASGASSPIAESAVNDSIVVMPFVNISGDAANEYFADGLTEEIINVLAQITDLHVVARSSAFSFKGKQIDPRVIGEQLNVRTVLEGSVRGTDSRLRITAQLVNSADGYHLWSNRYDREMKDVFAIQDEIARSIAQRLQVSMPGTQNLKAEQA